MKLKDCKMLEEAYQKYHNDLVVGKIPNITVQLENKMEVLILVSYNCTNVNRDFSKCLHNVLIHIF